MTGKWLWWSIIVVALLLANVGSQDAQVKHPELPRLVRNWAEKLGSELWHFGEFITRRSKVIESYRDATVVPKNGKLLLDEIRLRLEEMMNKKVAAVRRIMDTAENVAVTAQEIVGSDYDYYNAKELINSAAPPPEENDTDQNQEPEEFNAHQSESLRQPPTTIQEGYEAPNVADAASPFASMMQNDYPLDQEDMEVVQDVLKRDPELVDEDVPQSKSEEEDKLEELELETEDEEFEQEPMASLKPPIDKRRLPLYPNRHFYDIPVNMNVSSVHVPSNVFDRSPEVIKGIKWSEELDETFRNNYKQDPSMSWQYFGSSTGFMRQYPAMIWSQEPVDLFDCRMRTWYIEAASSPKDIIILIDRSGSMTGMRREIAKHVVNNILDTLGNNDYVNIYTFSNTTDPLIECFDGHLVQANLANIRVFKDAMSSFRTEQIANFSLALTQAFELLQDYRDNRPGQGAQCNQAIMLITDGVYYNFKEIFKEYNWKNLPFMPVRVFTYLIGREVSDVREVKWMACANQGFYVHLSTYAEVREQVLNYLPVMARPMVLNPSIKPNPTWTPVYADATDHKLTNWLWMQRQRDRQRARFIDYRQSRNSSTLDDLDRKMSYEQQRMDFNVGKYKDDLHVYRLMTSVSLPVYDKRQNATRIANLLGVAGTDVAIEDIERLMLPYRVGVNGYAFLVTNNGYILLHPDLRPVFQGILKPAYNRVDLVEVELFDDDTEPREFSPDLIGLRQAVINRINGNMTRRVKYHIDEMNRIMFAKRHYFYTGVANTSFSLVLALPDRYGMFEIDALSKEDVHRTSVMHQNNLTQFFTGNWTVHPAWHYCRYTHDLHQFDTPEEELLHFLEKMSRPGWKWNNSICDRTVINRVLYDAKATQWFNDSIIVLNSTKDENGNKILERFGPTVAFFASHSGLTRRQDFPDVNSTHESKSEEIPYVKKHFHSVQGRAIDEIWYRRAVEQHYKKQHSFVYSVPFDADFTDDTHNVVVTASHAIFKDEKDKDGRKNKAVVGVVGFQMYHRTLHSFFRNITEQCGDNKACKRTCQSNELYCMLVDDNGYIVVTFDRKNTGMFLGDLRPEILQMLVDERIYTRTRIYDYQATCFPNIPAAVPTSSSSKFHTITHIFDIFNWIMSTIVYFVQIAAALPGSDFDSTEATLAQTDEQMAPEPEDLENAPSRAFEKDLDQRLLINKTHPEPCDAELYLYHLIYYSESNITRSNYNKTMTDCKRPFLVQPVLASNMILLVINMLCPDSPPDEPIPSPTPNVVLYNESRPCHILFHNNFPRRNYMSCINRSTHEQSITLCGNASHIKESPFVLVICYAFLIVLLQTRLL